MFADQDFEAMDDEQFLNWPFKPKRRRPKRRPQARRRPTKAPRKPSKPRARQPVRQPVSVDRNSATYIRWVQRSLNHIMGLQLAVDGISGVQTRSAVRSFQTSRSITVDGIAGPETEGALIAAGAGQPPGHRTQPPAPIEPPPSEDVPNTLRFRAASLAMQEWERWNRGAIKECDSRIRTVLENYWRTAVGAIPTGTHWCSDNAWSGVFISWVMANAGAGTAFNYSAGHTDYVGAAKRNREANNNNPFKAYRLNEVAPRVGDLVCMERQNSGVTYDNVGQGFRPSHCDIVTKVRPGQIETVGGNLSDTIRQDTVSTDANGFITESGYYAVVRVGT